MEITLKLTPFEAAMLGAAVADWKQQAIDENEDSIGLEFLEELELKIANSFSKDQFDDAMAEAEAKIIADKLKRGEL